MCTKLTLSAVNPLKREPKLDLHRFLAGLLSVMLLVAKPGYPRDSFGGRNRQQALTCIYRLFGCGPMLYSWRKFVRNLANYGLGFLKAGCSRFSERKFELMLLNLSRNLKKKE